VDEIDTPLDGQMNGHIGQMDGQIDDEPPLDGQMNGHIGQMDGQIDDEPPLDGQMNDYIDQMDGQIDDEPPLDGQMNDYIGQMDCQIDDEFMPLDYQMNYYIGQMDGAGDDLMPPPSRKGPPSSSEANVSGLFPPSTKKWVSKISKHCWLCESTPYQFAHVLGKADRGVLLLQRT
jgi:hypothetical protein